MMSMQSIREAIEKAKKARLQRLRRVEINLMPSYETEEKVDPRACPHCGSKCHWSHLVLLCDTCGAVG
jgi:hypothetical protein